MNKTSRDMVVDLSEDVNIARCIKDDAYAHKLYAALCNTEWQPNEVMDILKENTWSTSWRSAGGIVAHLRGEGDYMDWYCSGNEGYVHSDIEKDLKRIGWTCVVKDDFAQAEEDEEWGKNTGIAGAFSRGAQDEIGNI